MNVIRNNHFEDNGEHGFRIVQAPRLTHWKRFQYWWYRTTGRDASRFFQKQIDELGSQGGEIAVPYGTYQVGKKKPDGYWERTDD